MSESKMKNYMKQYRTTHTQLVASIPADLAAHLKEKLKKDGMSYAKFLIKSIQEYLDGRKL